MSGGNRTAVSIRRKDAVAGALKLKDRKPVVGFNPAWTERVIFDGEANQAAYSRMTDPTKPVYWRGKWYLMCEHAGVTETVTGHEKIHLFTCSDPDPMTGTWTDTTTPVEVFNDPAYSTNPVTDPGKFWEQPNLIAPRGDAGDLVCFWQTAGHGHVSRLSSPTGKWTNARVEFPTGTATPVLNSTTGTDAPAGGFSRTATLDGFSDLSLFFLASPRTLSDGRIAVPSLLMSASLDPAASAELNTFLQQDKMAVVAFSDDQGATLYFSEPVPNSSVMRTSSNWETWIDEADNGDLYLWGRNMQSVMPDGNAMVVAISKTKGMTWSPWAATELLVSPQRADVERSGDFWVMSNTHHQALCTDVSVNNGWRFRFNPALGISRTGRDDFVFGIPLGEKRALYNYSAITVKDGRAYVAWGKETNGCTSLVLSSVAVPTDATKSYAFAPQLSEMDPVHGPEVVAGTPGRLKFDSQARATGAAWNPGASLTIAGWVRSLGGNATPTGALIVDQRDSGATGGVALRTDAVTLVGTTFSHGVQPRSRDSFYAVRVDGAARKVTAKVDNGSGTLQTFDYFVRPINIASTLPTDGLTITVDGHVFTWRTSATTSTEVTIGVNRNVCASNLGVKVRSAGFGLQASVVGSGSGAGDLIIARSDGTDFAISSTDPNTSLLSTIPSTLTNGSTAPNIGLSAITTSLLGFIGDVIDLQGWSAALSDAEIKYLYNQHATQLGYSAQTGASAPAGSPAWQLTNATTTGTFSNLADKPYGKVTTLTSTTAVINGEGHVPLDAPWRDRALSIAYACGAVASGTDKYVLATIGTGPHAQRLYINGANPNLLQLDGVVVGPVLDATRKNRLELAVTQDSIIVGGVVKKRTSPGEPRIALGNAFPEGLLAYSKTITFDLASMTVANYTDDPQEPGQYMPAAPTAVSVRSATADGSYFWQLYRQSEANPRVAVNDPGEMWFGPGGSTALDTRLLRPSAAVLKLVGLFQATDDQTARNDDSTRKVTIGAAGLAGGQAGITFGSVANETMLWRSVAKQITTDSELKSSRSAIGAFFTGIVTGDSFSRIIVRSAAAAGSSGAAQIDVGGGVAAPDVSVLWDSPGVLKVTGGLTIAGLLSMLGGQRWARRASAVSTSILATDLYVGITSTSAVRTATLPDSADATVANRPSIGQVFVVKDESGGANFNNIVIAAGGSDTFLDGGTTRKIRSARGYWIGMWNGTAWATVGGTTELSERIEWEPTDSKMFGWTFPAEAASGGTAPTAGVPSYGRLKCRKTGTLSNVQCFVMTGGSGATALANCYLDVIDFATGNRLGVTADVSTKFGLGSTLCDEPLIADQGLGVVAGQDLLVGLLVGTQSTTNVTIGRGFGGNVAVANGKLAQSDGRRFGSLGSGLTALPGGAAAIDPKTLAQTSAAPYYFSVS
jgi:hypothetical protein